MTLEELVKIDFTGKDTLILGKPGSGKTWLSKVLGGMYKRHAVINTDDYLHIGGTRAVEAVIEDQSFSPPCIIEGMMAYEILLEGAERKCYKPHYVIEVEISAGKQRELYLKERDASKIQYLKRFAIKMQCILNEYHRIVPEEQKPQFLTFNNNW